MGPFGIIPVNIFVLIFFFEISISISIFGERNFVGLVEHLLVKTLTESIGLNIFHVGFGMFDILEL